VQRVSASVRASKKVRGAYPTAVQPLDPVRHGVAGGENQHRYGQAASPPAVQHRQPLLARQTEIEQHQRVVGRFQRPFRAPSVLDPVHGEALAAQAFAQAVADHRVVFRQ